MQLSQLAKLISLARAILKLYLLGFLPNWTVWYRFGSFSFCLSAFKIELIFQKWCILWYDFTCWFHIRWRYVFNNIQTRFIDLKLSKQKQRIFVIILVYSFQFAYKWAFQFSSHCFWFAYAWALMQLLQLAKLISLTRAILKLYLLGFLPNRKV